MYIRTDNNLGGPTGSYLHDPSVSGIQRYGLFGEVPTPSGPITVSKLAGNLTNLVFWARRPNLTGKTLTPGSKEAAEWGRIQRDEVIPALHNASPERRIGQLIFFSRHPDILGHFKEQPTDKQQKLSNEFEDIRKNIVAPWTTLQLARGPVNSRTIFVIDNESFRTLPWETRTRAGDEIANQFAFVPGMTVVFVEPTSFPEAFNFSDAVVGVTDPMTPPSVHVFWALKQQVNNLNRAIDGLGSRQRFQPPNRTTFNPDRYGLAEVNKFVTPASQGSQVAAPLMTSAVNVNDLIDYLNKEYVPNDKQIPKDRDKWSDGQKELVGVALGRAMAHEVRHLYVRTPVHAADGLGSDSARLFGSLTTFSTPDKASITSAITTLEGLQGSRPVAASFAAAERSLDFPF
jgi:hypothetical protein